MNRDMVRGLMLGLGVGLVAPVMFPVVSRALRPSFNAAIRAGVLAWERGRETVAEMGEYVEDVAAEARAQQMGDGPFRPEPPGAETGAGRA